MIGRVLIAGVVAIVASTGCAFDVDSCHSDSDCPENTVCAQPAGTPSALCIAPEALPDAGVVEDGGQEPDMREDDDDGDPDPPDMSKPDEVDLGNGGDDAGYEAGMCGRSVNCDEFPLDHFGALNERVVGCPSREFVGFRETFEHGMCGDETDRFHIDYARCRDGTFTIKVVLDVGYRCTDAATFFLTERSCTDPDVECLVRGDGTTTVSVEIGRTDFATPIESFEFGVDSKLRGDEAGVWYLLDVDVSR